MVWPSGDRSTTAQKSPVVREICSATMPRRASMSGTASMKAGVTEATDAFIDAVPDIEALLGIVAEQISRTTGDFCAVVLLSPDGQTIEPVAAYHPDPRVMEDARHLVGASIALD